MSSHKIFLALGSNVGDKEQYIKDAITMLSEKVRDIKVAKFYNTEPWGYKNQDSFINTAIKGNTILSSLELLNFVKDIEKKLGRKTRFHWGPREIDIDIIFYNESVYNNQHLTIPHSRMHQRNFVLQPLMDLDPEYVHPILKKTVRELLEQTKK